MEGKNADTREVLLNIRSEIWDLVLDHQAVKSLVNLRTTNKDRICKKELYRVEG